MNGYIGTLGVLGFVTGCMLAAVFIPQVLAGSLAVCLGILMLSGITGTIAGLIVGGLILGAEMFGEMLYAAYRAKKEPVLTVNNSQAKVTNVLAAEPGKRKLHIVTHQNPGCFTGLINKIGRMLFAPKKSEMIVTQDASVQNVFKYD